MTLAGSNAARGWLAVLAAALCAAGMVLYLQRVVIPHQIADSALRGSPRGNLSDLYPRWLGARELLQHGRDPYAPDLTREIQAGYYGRALDAARPNDPKDEQRFAYPLYVVFLLAPTTGLDFGVVQSGFFWFLLLITLGAALLCLRLVQWSPPGPVVFAILLLTIGSPAVAQALKLRQLSLLVAAMVFVALYFIRTDRLLGAGVLLALSTIKPQLLCLLLLWLALWTMADWRRRYRLLAAFAVTLLALVVASELALPGWIPRFWDAVQQYQRYTGGTSVLSRMISPAAGVTAAILSLAGTSLAAWRDRAAAADSPAFVRTTALVLAVTVLVVPMFAPYNQILLLPVLLLAARDRESIWNSGAAGRGLLVLTLVAMAWPWACSLVLAALSFVLPPLQVQQFWTVPFWTVWLVPVAVASLMLVVARGPSIASGKGRTA